MYLEVVLYSITLKAKKPTSMISIKQEGRIQHPSDELLLMVTKSGEPVDILAKKTQYLQGVLSTSNGAGFLPLTL